MTKKIGVGIISWNRPQYLKELLMSLEKNELNDLEFHLFQDGHICKFTGVEKTNESLINESVGLFEKSKLPSKKLHRQKKNVSVAINQFEAMRFLMTNYEQFIFMENDVVVSKNFFGLMKRVLTEFENDDRIACISPGFRRKCYEDDIDFFSNKLMLTDGHFWAEACWSKKWKLIEDEYMAYYDIVQHAPYNQRNHAEIMALFNRSGIKKSVTSQDNGKDWAILKSGMRRARFIVNRATGIGDYGVHSTPAKMKKMGDGHNSIYEFDGEVEFNKFEISSLKEKPKNENINIRQ